MMGARAYATAVFAALGAAIMGVATGVVWMFISLYLRQPTAWLALPVGALLAWVLRSTIHQPGVGCAGLAVLSTAVAAASLKAMLAGVQIAGAMGLDLVDALHTAGSGLLWQLTRLATAPTDLVWYGLGAALAAAVAFYRRR